jgi:hypothetical protein
MAEFQVIKRSNIPLAGSIADRRLVPVARLHKGGTLYLSVLAAEALGDRDCRVLAEFDEQSSVLKLTVADKLPVGISQEDCFPMRIRKQTKGSKRSIGQICVKALLRYIGFTENGGRSQEFQIAALDPRERSITLVLPAEQLPVCDGSSR